MIKVAILSAMVFGLFVIVGGVFAQGDNDDEYMFDCREDESAATEHCYTGSDTNVYYHSDCEYLTPSDWCGCLNNIEAERVRADNSAAVLMRDYEQSLDDRLAADMRKQGLNPDDPQFDGLFIGDHTGDVEIEEYRPICYARLVDTPIYDYLADYDMVWWGD